MISAVLMYSQRGEILASRIYRDGLRRAVTDAFRVQVIMGSDQSTPLLTLGSTSFLHIRHNSMFIVAVTRHDVDGAAVFEFLYKLCEACTSQLGQFDEASCYRNVTQIYEILDELVDFGYVQVTEPTVLKKYLSGGAGGTSAGSDGSAGSSSGGVVSALKRTMTSAGSNTSLPGTRDSGKNGGRQSSKLNSLSEVPWRNGDVKHRRNEVYVDVIEQINAVFDPDGRAVSASVDGRIDVKSHLSGVPRCQIDLSQNTVLENSQFHSCVDHARFHNSGIIKFIPPEGEFELLHYRVTKGIKLQIGVLNAYSPSDGEHSIRIRCTLDSKYHLSNLVVQVPIPRSVEPNRAKCSNGKARFMPEIQAVEWKIGRLAGQHEATLRIRVPQSLGSAGAPITAKFTVNMYASSGLKVRSLQVNEDALKYTTLKWVRYLTEAGAVEGRLSERQQEKDLYE